MATFDIVLFFFRFFMPSPLVCSELISGTTILKSEPEVMATFDIVHFLYSPTLSVALSAIPLFLCDDSVVEMVSLLMSN